MPIPLGHSDNECDVIFESLSLLLFSVSSITKGKQFVPVLNALNVQVACYGNHEFGAYSVYCLDSELAKYKLYG